MSGTDELSQYDFELPDHLVAQRPLGSRRASRLLCWRSDGSYEHRGFDDLAGLLQAGDLLVLNDTRVFPARLFGTKYGHEAKAEVLLVRLREDVGVGCWEALCRPGRRLKPGAEVLLDGGVLVEIGEPADEGTRLVHFPADLDVLQHCRDHGHIPLPPYIRREDDAEDRDRYQTVFARANGSVAAPTAGLHFDEALLEHIRGAGIETASVTLHVGPGTFRPIDEAQLATGELHPEWRSVSAETIAAMRRARERGGRIVAVGTTVCRSLESIDAGEDSTVEGITRLMIRPGRPFCWVDVLVTNFHLPRSSLLLLVAALCPGRWKEAYALAVDEGYRFYSYGDANWIERTS